MSTRKVTHATKNRIAARQSYRCVNNPDATIEGLKGYNCPLWYITGDNRGIFDESGYDIDHIIEFCLTQNDNDDNLHALCKSCHRVKTSRFMSNHMKNNEPRIFRKNIVVDPFYKRKLIEKFINSDN